MIQSYVINLEKDVVRKELLLKNIEKYEIDKYIDFHFIQAIDKSLFNEYDFKICNTWMDTYLKTGITTGEIGCSLSHYKCWNQFYNSNEKHAIIFEDDICFSENFYLHFQHLLDYPEDADLVYIHRKPLNTNIETQYNNYFTNIKASYWTCGYLITRKGAEKLLKANFLNNLIVVDEFLPILYDSDYKSNYKKHYNINLTAYSLTTRFIELVDETFNQSNTFFSNYYKYDNHFMVITSDLNTSLSSKNRFIYSCEKYSLNYKIVNDTQDIKPLLETWNDDKIIIICDSNFSFFIDNPLQIFLKNENMVYSNFNNLREFTLGYMNHSVFFYGKNSELKNILNGYSLSTIETNGFVQSLSKNTDININTNIVVNGIIVSGKDNILLLNKYENYILNKIYKSYGFKLKNNVDQFSFKIRVNVFIYNSDYKECISNLKKIDYPKHLLDIHIYTNKSLIIDDIPIHTLDIFEAYQDMYHYYNEYDYVWLINSNYVITESSLLKNCINTNKNISSGLQKSKQTVFSNFWGDLTESGWYKRSNDYFDVINKEKINIWNVPFMTGNMLINTNVLKKYNLFKVINYNKNDNSEMILCQNARLNNEGLYLLNDKHYGYICEYNLPDLSDWSEESILHKDFYDFIYHNKTDIFNEVGQDIWSMPFFSSEFCKYLIELAEKQNNWSKGVYDNGEFDKRINNVENIPTQDIHLTDLKLNHFWKHVVDTYFKKIMIHLYTYYIKDYHIAFIVKYDYENGQRSLKPHHDASVYTINVALNSSDEYTGGGVNFLSKKLFFLNKNPGYLLLHPGRVTHYHEALPITSGKRYVLVSFNN